SRRRRGRSARPTRAGAVRRRASLSGRSRDGPAAPRRHQEPPPAGALRRRRGRGARRAGARARVCRRPARRPLDLGRLAPAARYLRGEEPVRFDGPLAVAGLAALPVLVALSLDRARRRVASQAEFGNPALIPNVVDRSPGRLRYLPPLTLLVAPVFLIVGVARPHATVSVPREEATIVPPMDVSRSMKATAIQPTRPDP